LPWCCPAEYGVTGVRTFIVSQDGVVYDKDFGPKTLDEFRKWSASTQAAPGPRFRRKKRIEKERKLLT